ncbi:thiol-disulfide oxidoreductase DCC family protein [Vreelandella piezotolerans]|uniref:Thiol-disulfide oxidoreductase DCC family protein n=1 Tax=Vreelandella piezotolerans TaxID=2609667 RepID=A0ABQ6X5I8_9GAMM|nr:thiol-disulfide oxidoreductase DCC family protein [Halomonas piezotolerans]KAE8437301.1 thiol-disulfide oxidoreductase DCC family protein [Halomonas piezotolerans]QJA23974.1 thiol-disulfide oxidoreductase DCC family protein [Halomonas piezotolerans]
MEHRYIVIFDGVCNFCSGAVKFIIKRDPQGVFAFTPMQSELAQELTERFNVPDVGADTLVLIKQGECFVLSDAALEIARDLKGPWRFCYVFKVVPRPIRDAAYKLFARHRYRLFGKKNACMVPSAEVKSRFLGIDS